MTPETPIFDLDDRIQMTSELLAKLRHQAADADAGVRESVGLEAVFRGVGWNVIKVIWGSDWDTLLARDETGHLAKRMGEVVDGEYQNYGVKGGGYIRLARLMRL